MNSAPLRRIVELDASHLPLACPNEHTPADLLHPRVWLAPERDGTAMCPYCGTIYRVGLEKTRRNTPDKG